MRQVIELGLFGSSDVLKREEFEARKKAEREKHLLKENAPKPLFSMGKDLKEYPFLQALANREELVRNGKLTVSEREETPRTAFLSKFVAVYNLYSRLQRERPRGQRVYRFCTEAQDGELRVLL